jgi:hypothetical protein
MSNPPLQPAPEPAAPEPAPERVVRHIHSTEPSDVEPQGLQLANLDLKAHEAKTARTLTLVLVSMLGASFIIHEGLVVLLSFYNKADAITTLEHTFNQWLPGLTGLVGTAVGFYLKERK